MPPALRSVKTRTERRSEPPFATIVELLGRNRLRLHMSAARSVDALLAGRWAGGARGQLAGACRLAALPCSLQRACMPARWAEDTAAEDRQLPASLAPVHARRQPVTQLRWIDGAGRMMVRLEGQPSGGRATPSSGGGSMRATLGEAVERLGDRGAWMGSLLALAAQYPAEDGGSSEDA